MESSPSGGGWLFQKTFLSRISLVHGERVSILDGVNFEHTRIDLTDVPEARIGDEVVLIGKQENEEISLEEVVEIRGTDLQEVCQSVRDHIARIHIKDGKPFKIDTKLGEPSP